MKVSEYIANELMKNGIDVVFSVTGGGAMHLNDAFGHTKGMKVVYNHHEQACSMAAEGYMRTSGRMACVCVTSGPGGTNTLTGVMGAWLDSIPMIVISGQMKYETTVESTNVPLRQLGFQEFNIIDAVKCMTKYAVFVKSSKDIPYQLEKAIYMATEGRPGPVWLDIPLDVQGDSIDAYDLSHFIPDSRLKKNNVLSEKMINRIVDAINSSERPVILAGNGIKMSNAEQEFIEFAEKLRIPVVHSWNGHGMIEDSHFLYAGRPGTIGTRGGNFVIQNADLVISLGCRMHIRLISYEWQKFARNARIIAVDIDQGELNKPTVAVDIAVNADVKSFIKQICEEDTLYVDIDKRNTWIKWCKEINEKYPIVLDKYREVDSPINPYVFMEELGLQLKSNDVIVASNGTACVCAFQVIKMKKGEKMFTNAGASSMGYGLPAAVGASLALDNKQRIICLEGDGSIQMNIQELQTIIHHRMNIKIFWLNNDGYHSIRLTQKASFDAESRGYAGVSSDSGISFPSAKKIAEAYGFRYLLADKLTTLKETISSAIDAEGPTLCEVILDKNQAFEPKLSSFVNDDGTITSPSLEDMYPFLDREEYRNNMISELNKLK